MRRNSVFRSSAPVAKTEARQKLSLYTAPPAEELTLDEFETFTVDRLRVLRAIESFKTRGMSSAEFSKRVEEVCNRFLPIRSYEGAAEDIRKDQFSHWLLRLAHCKTEDRRTWFLHMESALFRHRISKLSSPELRAFMHENGLNYEEVDEEEKETLRDALLPLVSFRQRGNAATFEKMQYFKLPFTEALQEIARRSVFLKQGRAYVPLEMFVGIITARFRTMLSRSMALGAGGFGYAAADPRIGPLVNNIDKQYVGRSYGAQNRNNASGIVPEDIDGLSNRSMPLCMRHLHKTLRTTHKLKHQGRMQYGLFLKGAGLSLEDAHRFFEVEYSKIMSSADYKKRYSYGWRHMYGKEGKRTDYTAYGCMQIIQGTPPLPGQAHGCPFRHFGEQQLSAMLGQMRITGADRENIVQAARDHHYQVACYRHFEVTHRDLISSVGTAKDLDTVGNHPNSYMAASMELHRKAENGNGSSSTTTKDKEGSQSPPTPTTA